MKPIKLTIKTKSETYPIIIGNNLIKNLSKILRKNSINFNQCLLIIDKKISKRAISKITKSLKRKKFFKYYYEANEKNKNQKKVNEILEILLKKNFSRQDCLITIGGGITGDVGGFAASLFKRGLHWINLPTTLLSQVDSAVGGKVGANTKQGKNLIGSFYQPKIVISDSEFLKSLPYREIVCGYAEILKHSLIKDKIFYNYLNKNIYKILKLNSPFIEKAIYKSCKIKKDVVEKDEKEKGIRKLLNFGHTFAHAYEATFGYSKKLNHGEAVILGIKSAIKFSLNQKLIKKVEYHSIISHINKLKLPLNIKEYFSLNNSIKILSFMIKDKKNNTDKINLILLKKIGSANINNHYETRKIKNFLRQELVN